MQSRRTILKTVGAGTVTAGLGISGLSGARLGQTPSGQVDSVRIPVLLPVGGRRRPRIVAAVRGFFAYFGYRGADIPVTTDPQETTVDIDETTYTIDVRSPGTTAQNAQTAAREVVDDASVIVGGADRETAAAISAVTTEASVPFLVGPADATGLTATEETCAESVFRAGETAAMDAITGARYLAMDRDDVDSAYIYHTDDDSGEAIREVYERVFEDNGVTVAGSVGIQPGGQTDWSGKLQQANEAEVDVAVGGFGTDAAIPLIAAFLDGSFSFRLVTSWKGQQFAAGVAAVTQSILGTTSASAIENAGLGPFPARYHWNQFDNDINDAVVTAYRNRHGRNPDTATAGLFTSGAAIVQAIEETGSTESADIIAALRGMSVEETLKGAGAYQFQAHNNQARSPQTVAPVIPTEDDQYWEVGVQPGDAVARIESDKTTPASESVTCDLGAAESGPPERTTEDGTTEGTEEMNTGSNGNDVTIRDDRETTTSTGGGSGEDGPLGPLVGLAGVAGGIGAAWLANRGDEETE
jgi:branched-chain amino acid transport system substrate-binding protein